MGEGGAGKRKLVDFSNACWGIWGYQKIWSADFWLPEAPSRGLRRIVLTTLGRGSIQPDGKKNALEKSPGCSPQGPARVGVQGGGGFGRLPCWTTVPKELKIVTQKHEAKPLENCQRQHFGHFLSHFEPFSSKKLALCTGFFRLGSAETKWGPALEAGCWLDPPWVDPLRPKKTPAPEPGFLELSLASPSLVNWRFLPPKKAGFHFVVDPMWGGGPATLHTGKKASGTQHGHRSRVHDLRVPAHQVKDVAQHDAIHPARRSWRLMGASSLHLLIIHRPWPYLLTSYV